MADYANEGLPILVAMVIGLMIFSGFQFIRDTDTEAPMLNERSERNYLNTPLPRKFSCKYLIVSLSVS